MTNITTTKTPFTLLAVNKSKEPKKVILFGTNRNYHKPNFGNDIEVSIENIASSKENDYGQLLMQLQMEPIDIALIRLQTTNFENFEKKGKLFSFRCTDANGCEYGNNFSFNKLIEINGDRLQKAVLDIGVPLELSDDQIIKKIVIDSMTQIELELEPESQMTIHIFPK